MQGEAERALRCRPPSLGVGDPIPSTSQRLDPPIPTFAETLEDLAARLRKQIGTVRRTRDLEGAHPRIQKLLDADEQRRARQAESRYPTFDAPVFETSFEKRRLGSLTASCARLIG